MRKTLLAALVAAAALPSASGAQTYLMRTKIFPATAAPASPPPAKTLACGVPQKTYWYSGGKQNNLPRKATATDAQAACDAFLAANPGMVGVCVWNLQTGASNGPTYVMSGPDATVVRDTGQYRNELYASTCQ